MSDEDMDLQRCQSKFSLTKRNEFYGTKVSQFPRSGCRICASKGKLLAFIAINFDFGKEPSYYHEILHFLCDWISSHIINRTF